ncbi:MAG: hypothetical protein FWE38_00045 [Firmicutes bacterium]|nr:hypothetical protein [Bacillota bacterium]
MKIKIHACPVGYQTKPTKPQIAASKKRAQLLFMPQELTIEEIAELIAKGHTLGPAILEGGMRSKHFVQQQLFMVDIDNERSGPHTTIADALMICQQNNLNPALYYHTFSSTDTHHKFRLAFVCDRVITDKTERDIMMRNLMQLFNQCDPACKDAARTFLGTNKKVVLL